MEDYRRRNTNGGPQAEVCCASEKEEARVEGPNSGRWAVKPKSLGWSLVFGGCGAGLQWLK
jgi:hypothetical protein